MNYKLISVLTFSLLLFSSANALARPAKTAPMQRGVVYSMSRIEINGRTIKGWFLTETLKPGQIKQPFEIQGDYTVIERTCRKGIVVPELNEDSIKAICPR